MTTAGGRRSEDKSFKICSVLGGLDVTRAVSSDARHLFEGAIEDVELIREYVSEAATNGGIAGGLSDFDDLSHTLQWKERGFDGETTTVEAGLGYVDDRPDRTIDRFVTFANQPLVGDKQTDMAIVDTVSNLFPWIVDRKSMQDKWWIGHQNGRSEGPLKEPFRFDALYVAAWIGSYGDAWAYYPPFRVWADDGFPFTFADVIGGNSSSHEMPYVEPNLPEHNPRRDALFTAPYPDSARPGLSLITAMAPIYFTGRFGEYVYNDTYLASTGVDIAVSAVSSLLDVLKDRLTKMSFAVLVDTNFNTIVISQSVVERIYPARTGLEEFRISYNLGDGTVANDRRNQTYLVSDTIFEDLTKLQNADWSGLRETVRQVRPGDREFSTIDITLTGDDNATAFYVMYERWKYVTDWVLMSFAPTLEVQNAINVSVYNNNSPNQEDETTVFMTGEKGRVLVGEAIIVNEGTLDASVTANSFPSWLELHPILTDAQTLRSGESLPLQFDVLTGELELGTSSISLTFTIQDDDYPDCFYNRDVSLQLSVKVTPKDCVAITGDKLRVPDLSGSCICVRDAVEIGGRCVSYFLLLPVILGPLLVIGLLGVRTYVRRKQKQADSVWAVKTSELHFDDVPEIIGRGTFGLVLLAEYRGTSVAVKRVIPPRVTSCLDSRSERIKHQGRGLLFNFENDSSLHDESVDELQSSLHSHTSSVTGMIAPQNSRHRSGTHEYSRLCKDFVKEMRLLSKLRHPCITTVMGAVISKWEEPLLVMEYMQYGSLFDLLHNETMVIEGDIVLPILRDIAQGLRFLHAATPEVIHGDLKAQNVLVDIKFRAKVADFGLSQKKTIGVCGTPLWMAPELLRGETENTAASDVYSFGIILYEVYSRKLPYEGEDTSLALRLVCDPETNKRPPVPSPMPPEVASLMSDCLDGDYTTRPTFCEIDNRLKRFDVVNVEPGNMNCSMQAKKLLDAEKLDKATNLLLEIFPKHVADALSNGRRVEPEHFDCVTIFFSDIVGFTTISGAMSPAKVSDMLDRLYLKFDSLSHKHDVFKIDTIGDAWVGVTNVSKPQLDHTKCIAEFAIDAIKAANETMIDPEDPSTGFVQIRVGFHSGPVIANVVGSRNPKYTILGDSVNCASRMESNSLPGRILCSARSAKLLRQSSNIPISYRGKIEIKGKGAMRTYWVNEVAGSRNNSKANASAFDFDGSDVTLLTGSYMESSMMPTEVSPLLV